MPKIRIDEAFVVNYLSRVDPRFAPMLDGSQKTRDIDAECGYPTRIDMKDYLQMYERNDIASRVVDIEPDACWKDHPEIVETDEQRTTEFEQAVKDLVEETRLYTYLHKLDKLSGIGEYGVMLIGLSDGGAFDEPAPGFDASKPLEAPGKSEVLYYRLFDQSQVEILDYEKDDKNPRYGLPTMYQLTVQEISSEGQNSGSNIDKPVKAHWSRCIHAAPDTLTSEVFSTPRMKNVFNRLMDLRKINGGAGEMFWKGGFPGYSFEVDPQNGELGDEDREKIREEINKWENGLTRYFAGVGVKMIALTPQLADPTKFVDNTLRLIAAARDVPLQYFMGSHDGQSTQNEQDKKVWDDSIALRRDLYVTPCLIKHTIDRLQQYGALPPTEKIKWKRGKNKYSKYQVRWAPLAQMTEAEKAEVALKRTEALARYATAGAEALVPLKEFLTTFLKLTTEEAEVILKAARSELSVVLKQLKLAMEAGATGSAGGNVPTSVPKMAKTKDPTKTPKNVVQPKKE